MNPKHSVIKGLPCIHVNPPGSSGSLPEMQPDSRTPGSETEPPGCENTKKKKILF